MHNFGASNPGIRGPPGSAPVLFNCMFESGPSDFNKMTDTRKNIGQGQLVKTGQMTNQGID